MRPLIEKRHIRHTMVRSGYTCTDMEWIAVQRVAENAARSPVKPPRASWRPLMIRERKQDRKEARRLWREDPEGQLKAMREVRKRLGWPEPVPIGARRPRVNRRQMVVTLDASTFGAGS